jgi:hypothetical protein
MIRMLYMNKLSLLRKINISFLIKSIYAMYLTIYMINLLRNEMNNIEKSLLDIIER